MLRNETEVEKQVHIVIPEGTKVLTRPGGRVGIVAHAPSAPEHSYRVRFADGGPEESFRRVDLTIFKHVQDEQTRSFLYVDECIEGIRRLMDSDFTGPVNIGSEEMVTINAMARIIMEIAGKKLTLRHIPGPVGVRGRNSDNRLIEQKLGWKPTRPLREGLEKTYAWVNQQVNSSSAQVVPSR
jgi:nucleoside-diphosphate-sugar epimerase